MVPGSPSSIPANSRLSSSDRVRLRASMNARARSRDRECSAGN
jgi:hypothetical protein